LCPRRSYGFGQWPSSRTEFANCGLRATGRRTGSPRRRNCSKAQISDLERGNRGLDIDWMRRIAKALGVTPGELLSQDDNPLLPVGEEREIVERYRHGSAEQRGNLARVVEALIPVDERKRKIEGRVSQQNASETKSAYCEQDHLTPSANCEHNHRHTFVGVTGARANQGRSQG
jgi:transcriptional regulator with XRE-family HTH domain